MSTSCPFGIIHQRIDTVAQSQKTTIDITSFIFTLVALSANLLWSCKINNKQLATCPLPFMHLLDSHLEYGMRTGWNQVGLSRGWGPFGCSSTDDLHEMVSRFDKYFCCFSYSDVTTTVFSNCDIFFAIFREEISDIFIIDLDKTEFERYLDVFTLQLLFSFQKIVER